MSEHDPSTPAPESAPRSDTPPEWAQHLAVFDTETTGVDTRTARIVSAGIAEIDAQGAVVSRRDWLIDPGVEIPWAATRVHGITTQRARDEGLRPADAIAQILGELRGIFGRGVPVVAYNAPYDFSILRAEAERLDLPPLITPSPIVDPLVIDKEVDTYRRGKRTLGVTCEHYAVRLDNAHDSMADAVAAGRLAQALAAVFPDQLRMTAQELHTAQILWAREQAESFTHYMRTVRGRPEFRASGSWPER
ncbi:MAG: 3'-5' exonuclease [Microbacteriaceae bacterium]|jgi:DNA polymerase-3 subunit epsilon|nr:3'-5' exonuclease [Microbacteriaceae bacterium]